MSKNMTRKGLAFGAGFALVASGVAGSPAFADEHKITLAPSAGSGFSTIAGSKFTLNATIDSTVDTGTYTYLRYQIENPDQELIDFEMIGGGSNTSDDTAVATGETDATAEAVGNLTRDILGIEFDASADKATITTTSGDALAAGQAFEIGTISGGTVDASTTTSSLVQSDVDAVLEALEDATHDAIAPTSATVITVQLADGLSTRNFVDGDFDDNGVGVPITGSAGVIESDNASTDTSSSDNFVVEPGGSDDAAIGNPIQLTLDTQNFTKEQTLTVTAFLDTDGSNSITGNEAVSEPVEITFVPASDLIGQVNLTTPVIDATTIVANVGFTNDDINVRQIDSTAIDVDFSGDVSDTNVAPSFTSALGFAATTAHTVAAGESFTAKMYIDQDDDGSVNKGTVEDEDSKDAGSVEADIFTIGVVTGDGVSMTQPAVKETTTANDDPDYTDATGSATVRTETETVTLTGFVGNEAATTAPVDDKVVTVGINPSGVTASDNFTVAGKQVSSNAADTYTVVTNNDGIWELEIGTAGLDAGDNFKVQVTADGVSSGTGYSGNGTLTVTVADSDYDLIDVTDVTGENERTIEEGDTVTMTYRMVDQFGEAPDNGEYRVALSDIDNNRATEAADIAASANVVDGVATVTFTDNGEGTGTTTVRAAYGEVAGALSTNSTDRVSTEVNVVDDAAAASITLADLVYGSAQYVEDTTTDNRDELLLEDKAFGNYDANLNVPGSEAPDVDNTFAVTVSGTIENADGDDLAGAPITMSATGLLFKSGSVFGDGEITFVTDSSGDFEVDVWSQVGGTRTITMTSGDLTDTTELTYAGGAAGSEDDLSVATVTDVTPGTTTNVVATVQDDKGNGVKGVSVSFTTTIGYMAQATVTTDANGVAVGKLVTAPNDNGASTVTVSIPDNDDIAAVTQTVNVGTVASADQKVNAGSFKGFVAVYAKGYEGSRLSTKIGKDWIIVPSLASNFERITDFTGAGVDIEVQIWIDRVLIETIPLTTK